ncbi:MAG: nucleotide pyrophosphohydrolase [Anaerolineales bacterium]
MNLSELTEKMHQFVESKGWYEPDSPRPQEPANLALALSLESAEVLELYAWGKEPGPESLGSELADVALYTLQLASLSGIDLEQAILDKLALNETRHWDG